MNLRTEVENFPNIVVSKKIKVANSIIPRNIQWVIYITSLVIFDAAMTFLAFWLAYYFRFEWFVQYFVPNATISFERYRFLIYSMPFVWLVIFAFNGLYAKSNLLGGTREYSKIFRSAGEGFMLIVIIVFLDEYLSDRFAFYREISYQRFFNSRLSLCLFLKLSGR